MRREIQPIGVFVVSTAVLIFYIWAASASVTTSVVITELMWDGTEYVELFNTTDSEVSLSAWQLTRQQSGGEEKVIVTFDDGEVIGPGEYFLIEKNEGATSVTANTLAAGLTLVNTGELVRLKDSSGNLVDSANREGSWLAGKDTTHGEAMERSDMVGSGVDKESWHTSTGNIGERVGTPGQANTVVPVNHVPQAVIASDSDGAGVNALMTFSAEDSSDADGDELTFSWDFGDGASGSGSVATHAFNSVGNKIIQVTVSDGVASSTASLTVTVSALAYSNDLSINEFLPDPTGSDTDNEFIEVFNTGGVSVDLGGWQLDDADGGSAPYVIPTGTSIAAGGYVSFVRALTKLALNNDGDSVRLLSPDGNVKSSASYEDSTEGQSWNRTQPGKYEKSTTLTAGAKNVITAPVTAESESESGDAEENSEGDFSNEIMVNELLPNPTGSDTENEFIEIFNKGSAGVNLAGWKLDDEDGGSSPYTIPSGTTLAAGKLLALRRSQTKLALNNDADSVRLMDPAGKEISAFMYEESVAEGVAWARDNAGKFQLTSTVTEGKANVITLPAGTGKGSVAGASVKTVVLKDIRAESEGTIITTEGVVSAAPGLLGKGIFYLAGSGVQVYLSEDEMPELALGDKIKLTGELTSYLGETRLKVAAATDVAGMGAGEAPLPHQVKIGEVGEATEGFLVVIVGKVTETSGDTFYIDDGSGAIKVFIKESTGIEKPKMKKGDVVTITGMVSQTTSGYRVLPRVQEDVRLGAVAGLKTFPGTGLAQLWIVPKEQVVLLALAALWLSVFASRDSLNPHEYRSFRWR